MLRLSIVLLASLEEAPLESQDTAATAQSSSPNPAIDPVGIHPQSGGAFAFHGMRFQEEPLTKSETDAITGGSDAAAGGFIVVDDAELDTIRAETASPPHALPQQRQTPPPSSTSCTHTPLRPQQQQQQQQHRPEPREATASSPVLPIERLVDVEFCVAAPPVREVWPCPPAPAALSLPRDRSSNHNNNGPDLFAEELPWSALGGVTEEPFLHVYALAGSGPGGRLSRGIKEALALMVMRMLRHQLVRLLRRARVFPIGALPECGGGDVTDEDEEESDPGAGGVIAPGVVATLLRCCQQQPPPLGGLCVTWSAELLTAVARTIRLGNEGSPAADTRRPPVRAAPPPMEPTASDARAEAAEEEEGPAEMHRDSDGLEAWSDGVAGSSSSTSRDECPLNESDVEGRAVWHLRRTAEREVRRLREAADAAVGPEEEGVVSSLPVWQTDRGHEVYSSPLPAAVVAPLCLRHVPLRATALSLHLTNAHALAQGDEPLRPVALDGHLCLRFLADAVAVVQESKADGEAATAYAMSLYHRHVLPAEKHLKAGTASFQSFHRRKRQCSSSSGREAAAEELTETLREALGEYTQAAQLAQEGLHDPFRHAPRWQPLEAAMELPKTGYSAVYAEQVKASMRSRERVHAALEGLAVTPQWQERGRSEAAPKEAEAVARFCQSLLHPMAVPGEGYYNEAILRARCDGDQILKDGAPSVQAAQRAVAWRHATRTRSRRTHPGSTPVLPRATTLQLLLYALRRLLATATANAALTALTLMEHAQRQWSMKEANYYAAPCDVASSLALSLLRWHEPLPSPLTAAVIPTDEDDGGCDAATSTAAAEEDEEVLWCLAMHCKLRLRGARLLDLAGNTDAAQRWRRELGEAVARWGRHRQRHSSGGQKKAAAGASVWSTLSHSPEAMACRVPEEWWARLVTEVCEALQQQPSHS